MFYKCFRIFFGFIFFSILIKTSGFGQSINVSKNVLLTMPADYMGFNGSNVIRSDSPFWDDSLLVDKFTQLYPGNSRFPAGELANWWDWRTGYIKTTLPDSIVLRGNFESLNFKDNTLNRYKTLIEKSVATPIFDLNLLTSNKPYEAAGLFFANGLNLPTRLIELGTEFYLDKDEYIAKYEGAYQYALQANDWAAFLKSLPNGNDMKIAALGAVTKFPAEPLYSRQNQWLPELLPHLSPDINAITLHNYVGANISLSQISTENLPHVMAAPFENWLSLTSDLNMIRPFNKNVWITEFNLFDRKHCVQGTWASALFTSAMQMTYLEDTLIQLTSCHTMVGNAIWSMIFNDTLAFELDDFYFEGTNCVNSSTKSDPYEFSGGGNSMSLVAKAMKGAQTRCKLVFNNAPLLPGNFPAIYGWQFDGAVQTTAAILNLDSVIHEIQFDTSVWNLSSGSMIQYYTGPGGPLALIKGNAVSNAGLNEVYSTGNQAASQYILLNPYSITYIEKKKQAVTLKVLDNTICSGTHTSLRADGGSGLVWSGGNLTPLSTDNRVKRFTAPLVSIPTTYTITVTDISGATASVTLTVYPKPVLTTGINHNEVCKGFPVKLSAALSGGNAANFQSIIWIQDDGQELAGSMNPIVNVYPQKTTSYFALATDGLCWSALDSQKVVVTAIANAGANRFVCTDSLPFSLTAQNALPGFKYSWYHNNTLLDTGITTLVSPVSTSTYTLKMINTSDSLCTDTASVTLDPVICCASADTNALTFGNFISTKQFGLYMQSYCAATGQGIATATSLSNFDKEIVFNGTLSVDRSFIFSNCPKLKFGQKAEIVYADNSYSLTFKKCSLDAANCSGTMWRGIRANLFNVVLNLDSCYIANAMTAVEAQDDAVINIDYCTFKNNYKGIDVFDYVDELEGSIKGDSFIYTSLLPPYNSKRAFCAICLDDVTGVRIGDSTYNEPINYFANHDYGIYTPGSQAEIFNSKFANFYPDDTINLNEGSAVYCFNKNGNGNIADTSQLWPVFNLKIGNTGGGTKGNYFENCSKSVTAVNTGIKVKGNTITNSPVAISCLDCMLQELEASDNNITGSDQAITFLQPSKSSLEINNNIITTGNVINNGQAYTAIRVADHPVYNSSLTVNGNYINLYGTHGIYITANDSGVFKDNKVYLKHNNATNEVNGYRFEDCDVAEFSCNLGKGLTQSNWNNKKALVVINSDRWNLRCSNVDKVAIGMEMIGNCHWMQLNNNEFYVTDIGMQVGADGLTGGRIGPQPAFGLVKPSGNKFFGNGVGTRGTFGTAATRSVNSYLAGGQFDTTRFLVYNADSVWIPYPNIVSGNGSALTPFYVNKSNKPCAASCNNPNPGRPRKNQNRSYNTEEFETEHKLEPENFYSVIDQLLLSEIKDASNYDASFELYKLIQTDPALNINNPVSIRFNKHISKSNMQSLLDIENKLTSLSETKNGDNNLLNHLLSYNNSLVPINLAEQNRIKLNLIILQSLLYGNRVEHETKTLLRQVAFQCPYKAGDAVFKARALYEKYSGTIIYNDLILCSERLLPSTTQPGKQNQPYIHIYPQTASDMVTLETFLPDTTEYHVSVTDAKGINVYYKQLNSDGMHHTINTSDFKPGVYILSIIHKELKAINTKLVITR